MTDQQETDEIAAAQPEQLSDPASSEPPPAEQPPPWKNPWVVGFILGLIIITGIRPCTRFVPEPPEVRAQLPAFELQLSDSTAHSTATLWSDDVQIVHTVPEEPASLDTAIEHIKYMSEQFERANVTVEIWSLLPPQTSAEDLAAFHAEHGVDDIGRWQVVVPDADGWTALRGDVLPSVRAAVAADEGWEPDERDDFEGWVIIDPDGGVRGYYPTTRESVQEELLHRSRRTQLAYEIR